MNMANKNIPLKDKELVKQRLAQGVSMREAIKGTAIKSTQTASRILKDQSNEIKQIKEKYLQLIEEFGAGHLDRAKLWAEMAHATKVISARVTSKEANESTDDFIDVPDWQNREKALRYIDELAGLAPDKSSDPAIQVNVGVFNNATMAKEASIK